jgi:hypothetical protein
VLQDLAASIDFSLRRHARRREHFILNENAAGVTLLYETGWDAPKVRCVRSTGRFGFDAGRRQIDCEVDIPLK